MTAIAASPAVDTNALPRAIAAARRTLEAIDPLAEPLFPMTAIRFAADEAAAERLVAEWVDDHTSESSSSALRYPWSITSRYQRHLPPWIPPRADWRPWRPGEAEDWERDPRRFEARLLIPLILTEATSFLAAVAESGSASRQPAVALLGAAMPKLRVDFAFYTAARHAWGDTFALWALARRPLALRRLHPFALAIADAYGDAARAAGGVGLGSRFPFHERPLVSVSAQLARGLLALGLQPALVGQLAAFVKAAQAPEGGWGDADGPVDILTSLVALDLLCGLDPAFDPAPALRALERLRAGDGWWRAFGPDTFWLTAEVLELAERASLPFSERFAWPHLSLEHLDRRTGLPFLSYLQDVVALVTELPRLGAAELDVAFLDLADFGEWNNRFGMDRGDELLVLLAEELRSIPGALAVRDGGDEFLVIGRPGAIGLPAALDAFRRRWPERVRERLGNVLPASPRIVVTRTRARDVVRARDELGRAIGPLKHATATLPADGIQVALATLTIDD